MPATGLPRLAKNPDHLLCVEDFADLGVFCGCLIQSGANDPTPCSDLGAVFADKLSWRQVAAAIGEFFGANGPAFAAGFSTQPSDR